MNEPRRTFAPVVLLGLVSGALSAVAGNEVWAVPQTAPGDAGLPGLATDSAQLPLATALSLVVLAAWGVLLVTRGRFRRGVAVVGVLGAAGTLAVVVAGYWAVPDALREEFQGLGIGVTVDFTAWYPAAVAAACLSLVATVLAVRWTPAWPEMGSRYDAPGAATADEQPERPEDRSSLDLWKTMDEGRDPTA